MRFHAVDFIFVYFSFLRDLEAGIPNLWAADQYQSRPVRNWLAQQEGSLNAMRLNHPKTTPHPPIHGKIVFHKTGSWCQKMLGTTA